MRLTYQPLLTGRCLPVGSGRTPTPRSICQGSGRVVGKDSQERAAVCCWHRSARSQSPHSCRHSDVCSWAETSHHCGISHRPGHTSDPLEPCRCLSQCHSAHHSHNTGPYGGHMARGKSRAPLFVGHTLYSSCSRPALDWCLQDTKGSQPGSHMAESSPDTVPYV